MSNYNKISLAQIDIESVSDYVVNSRNLVYRSGEEEAASTNAQDVDKVAGVNADSIAIAADPSDRNTVQNALQLGGLAAEEYMTNTQGDSLATKQDKEREEYGNELQNLKDELYTLRQELAKGGLIEDRGEYTGYIDTFRAGYPKHIAAELAPAASTDAANRDELFIADQEVFNSLDIYDYVVIDSAEVEQFVIRQIKDKDENTRTLTLDSSVPLNIYAADMMLYLSHGINDEGMFKFARAAELAMSSEENHTGLSDDTYRIMKHTFTPNTGFGYSFRIPAEKQGYVTSFEICAKAYGSPGSMVCYLIDDRDLNNFHSPSQAAADYTMALENKDESFHFFAASRPLTLSSAYGRRYIRFDFLQEDETYPLMTQDQDNTIRYIAIIECLDCDSDNYYDIQFLQHRNSEGQLTDLELNNITYTYTRRNNGSSKKALETNDDINASDMYYHIVTRSVLENEVEPDKEGLYTFHVRTKDPANKIRVMLRIRKEGAYVANTEDIKPLIYNGDPIVIINKDTENGIKSISELYLHGDIYNPLEIRASENMISQAVSVILGQNITKLAGRNETTVTVADPVLLNNGDPVYRMAYLVSVKARFVNFEIGIETVTGYDHYVVPIKEVFKDFRKFDKTSSDRILFETDMFNPEDGTDVPAYNDFIVQIFWQNRDMSDYKDIRKSQMGAIKDIAVAFNQGF